MAKGIMFTEAMFNEVIEWRKTQTRRIVKPKPGPELFYVKKLNKNEWVESDKYTGYYSCVEDGRFYKPRYQLGEKVYIREPYDFGKHKQGDKHLPNSRVFGDIFVDYPYSDKGYYPGIKYTMPEKYARYFIEITSLRCERLQDISDEDCLKEGIKKTDRKTIGYPFGIQFNYFNGYANYTTQKEAYAALINEINGKGTWEANPYVWVYDFKLINNQ